MNVQITSELSPFSLEKILRIELPSCDYWGDLNLTIDDFESLGILVKSCIKNSTSNIDLICKSYPCCMTTYMVFFAVYKYDYNFWGAMSEDLEVPIPPPQQERLGDCARRMFDEFSMDYSDSKEEARRHIAPIIYEACVPPDSSLDDLFYVMNNDANRSFDPQLLIDDLIDMRSYAIRKPLKRFLERFKDDRAIEYLIEVYDSIVSAEQKNSAHSRYTDQYYNWKANERTKSGLSSRKDKEHQARPYLYFDEERYGLSILLPKMIVESEWIDVATWLITSNNGFSRVIECRVFGDEGHRYTGSLSVSVPPADCYQIKLNDTDSLENKAVKQWEVDGIPSDNPVWFNHNGRRVNANYLLSPYGILIAHSNLKIASYDVSITEQYYPNISDDYRIVSVVPLGTDARVSFNSTTEKIDLFCRPQINMELYGKVIFGLKDSNLFTEIPQLKLVVEGEVSKTLLELRVNNHIYPVTFIGDEIDVNLSECLGDAFTGYGTYCIRLYQNGRFLKQVDFNYIPAIQSDYSTAISWPSKRSELNQNKTYRFKRLKDWELTFECCDVCVDEERYTVSVSPLVGTITCGLRSLLDDNSFTCSFDLPVNPFEYELVSLQGDEVLSSTMLLRTDVETFLADETWCSLKFYASFKNYSYSLALKTINGIEQVEPIVMNNKGAGGINLVAFFDTIRNSPLPLEILLTSDSFHGKEIPIVLVSESTSLAEPVTCVYKEKRDLIRVSIKDDGKDLVLNRFGFESDAIHLSYSNSILAKSGMFRGYPLPGKIAEGFYIVSVDTDDSFFDEEVDGVTLQISNNLLYSRCQRGDKRIITTKHLLDLLLKDVISAATANQLVLMQSYEILMDDAKFQRLIKEDFDDYDLERLVALAFIANDKIENKKRNLIETIMRRISVSLMKRGDRYRVIELLSQLKVSQEVFDTCLKDYSLLLVYSNNPERKSLAGKVEKYSPELAMILMMSTNGPIRDCLWKYSDVIGRDALRSLISVPDATSMDDRVSEQKRFFREDNGVRVTINLDDQIAGNLEAIQGMISYSYNQAPQLDISKKPEYGIYFDRIRYVDQFVNWYKITHNEKGEMNPVLRRMMTEVMEKYGDAVIKAVNDLKTDTEMSRMTSWYRKVIEKRIGIGVSERSYAWFFYLQGLASFLTRLPVESNVYDSKRLLGISFMSAASVIAPKMSQRDILMAQVYIYLKKKEELICL